MSALENINKSKSMSFCGYRMTISDEPAFIELAEEMNMPRLRYVSVPVVTQVDIPPESARLLLDFLHQSSWRRHFEENLQCMAETDAGEPLLTGWMALDILKDFLDRAGEGEPVRAVLEELIAATESWAGAGVEEVYFDGYRL